MLRLCNVNRCGVYNYSCLASGGASAGAPLGTGCSRGGPGRTAAPWAAPFPSQQECFPGNAHPPRRVTAPGKGLLWTASQLLLAFLLCELRLNLCSPVKKVFFFPSKGKIPSSGEQWGWDSLWHALAGCNLLTNAACGDAALLTSAGYIPPPCLP